ncbi:hypothetical protein JCGZ_03853 [Jatropha curcas]|uniref:Uncharacterized protein n=1 Tax=Jatropha curcas TaxID=180498 RepID=A0A067KZM6_JATCU|nr:hypothetical protein JCGZ_03853 [Jatropha curcas]
MAKLPRTARTIAPLTASHAKVSGRCRLTTGSGWFVIVGSRNWLCPLKTEQVFLEVIFIGWLFLRGLLDSELAGVEMDSQQNHKRCAIIGVLVWR